MGMRETGGACEGIGKGRERREGMEGEGERSADSRGEV